MLTSVTRKRSLRALMVVALLASVLVVMPIGSASAVPGADSAVFINEIHYDNDGTDAGEAIEVAGPAGTDLSGWSLVLYNGNNSAVYDTTALSGVLGDLGDGYGVTVVDYPANGIQNGAPDGMALVDGTTVVQFLSYEGTFTATDGPASGMMSTDIGVSESGSTPVGSSLQLAGTGASAGDFTWAPEAPNTFSASNTGQTFDGAPPPPVYPDLFVNELHYDNASTDVGEGVEVAGPAGSDLTGWSIVFYNGNGGAPYATLSLSGTIPDQDGGYGTLEFPQSGIQNGSPDGFALVDPASAVVQFLSYEGTFTAAGGPADGMTSVDIGVSQPGDTPVGNSLQLMGTGTTYAEFTWAEASPETFGAVNTGQSFGGVIDQPVEAFCDGPLVLLLGTAGSVDVTASDADETVVDISGVVNGDPTPGTIEVGPTTPASGPGEVAVATVAVSDTVAAGAYTVDITATNDADPLAPGDTDTCTLDISVVDITGITPIYEIQGSGDASPIDGEDVTTMGVVVGDYQGNAGLNGFNIQDQFGDGDLQTSDGIFVYDFYDVPAVDVNIGDLVVVEGTVDEFFGQTQLTFVSVGKISTGNALPEPGVVSLPVTAIGDFESFEGMGITVPGPLYVTDNYNWHRNGEVQLSVGGVLDNPTNVVAPGDPANALQDLNDRSQIQLDDGSNTRSPALMPPPYMEADDTLRRGGSAAEIAGVMSYSFSAYEIHPTGPISFTRENDRVGPPDVGGSIQVGAYNVLNYFTTVDTGAPICGPDADQNCRGADSASELTRQRDKIVDAIVAIDADVLGLMEIENHSGDVPVADLVAGVNAVAGAGTYDYIATGAVGTDAIRQAVIYQPGTVTPVGAFALLDESEDSRFLDSKNRPTIAQTFEENATGERLTVAVNHLKSKGSACDDVGDPDAGDGQGNCNGVRTAAAAAMVDWLAGDPTGSGDPDFLIAGDLNAYAMEDPIAVLTDAGYVDMVAEQAADDYSYVFFGQSGYLDHALASPSLAAQIVGTEFWHTNADEPKGLDYNEENNQPFLYNPDEWRASDHDPVIAGLVTTQTPIYDIQGDGDASPYEGEVVRTTGVVTGDFQGDDALRGFYAQDVDGDANPATSDGIFVFDRFSSDVDVSVGDLVEITGEVDEYYGETQLTDVTVTIVGTDSVLPTAIAMPVTGQSDFEVFEGMLVTFPEVMSATDHYSLHRFGEVELASEGRQFQPTNFVSPVYPFDDNGLPSVADVLEPYRILLDDGNRNQFPDEVPYLNADGTLRLGDTVTGLTGNMAYSFSRYRINPTEDVAFAPVNPRPSEEAPDVGGDLRVASYNLLNYWTTIDDGSIPYPDSPRGADSDAEFERQRAKTVTAILAMDAQIIGLQELENNGPDAISDLVNALNDATAPGTWAAVPDAAYPGGIESTNAIKVGIIYQPAAVAPLGPPVADPAPVFAEDRPPVAQTFVAEGEVFTVMVNHFKSKGCTDATGGDEDQNDGQACYNERRTNQAAAVLDFVAALQAATGDDDVLVIGDLNSYLAEDPIAELETGLDNLVGAYIDPLDQYSYVYFGMAGMLDYAFSTESLTSKVTGTAVWHINADEPRVLDYNDDIVDPGERSSELMQEQFDPNIVYRSSDHDPVIVGLELGGTSAKGLKREAKATVAHLMPSGDDAVDESLRFAKSRISQSLRSKYWRNANALRNNGAAVFTHEWNAANALDPIAAGEGATAIGAGAAESKLVAADYLLARYELERAIAGFGDPVKIAQAEGAFARGEAAMAAGDYLAAISYYRWAWIRARQAT